MKTDSTIDLPSLLAILEHGNQLKRTTRTGWAMRGIPLAESVAEHTFGVAFTVMMLAPAVDVALNRERLLALAIIHDLPEGITTDIPAPVWRRLPAELKPATERHALETIFEGVQDSPQHGWIAALWAELETSRTAEARLVHEADKLEMYLQAHLYQQQFGSALLDEFWSEPRRFEFPVVQALYDLLRRQHVS